MRLRLAIRAFFRVLWDKDTAAQISAALGTAPPTSAQAAEREPARDGPAVPAAPARRPVARSEAITLLAALQREARFVDIVREPLDQYSDAQIGAAARDVLKDCGRVLDRLFALRPLVEQPEGAEVEAPAGYDAGCYRLAGNVHGQPPFRGRLAHHGWQATRCELPQWAGSAAAASVVAPLEIEVR